MWFLSIKKITILLIHVQLLAQKVSCELQSEPQGGAEDLQSEQEEGVEVEKSMNTSLGGLSDQNYRDSKFVSASLFTVVRFKNVDCISPANLITGTCYTSWDCVTGVSGDWSNQDTQIAAHGKCQTFGKCCTSILGCGASSSNNNTWLRSPGYPSTFNSGKDCDQTVTLEDNICQLRLDIDDLSLDYPDSTGTCATDYLKVNHDIKFDKLCGITKNNHFYLDVDYSSNSKVVFSFHTESSTSFDRSWSIRVTKIVCDSPEEVPRGCGQYYTGTTSLMKGLNYEAPSTDNYLISNLNYGVCVRMENGYCKNTYTEHRENSFSTICPDLWELPGRLEVMAFTSNNQYKCWPAAGAMTRSLTSTYAYVAPHIFKLDTTRDTTNTHRRGDENYAGVYYMSYQQTKC